MRLSDFLSKASASSVCLQLSFEVDILEHLDAYILQLWPKGKVLVVCELAYREFVEERLLSRLAGHGLKTSYCLCLRAIDSYPSQILASIDESSLEQLVGIVSLGSAELFHAAKSISRRLNKRSCALLDTLAPIDLFSHGLDAETLQEVVSGKAPTLVDAVFFDLGGIAHRFRGDMREAGLNLEIRARAMRCDELLAQSLGDARNSLVQRALEEAVAPKFSRGVLPNEDELAGLCEASAWLSTARLYLGRDSCLDRVIDYERSSANIDPTPVINHGQVFLRILSALIALEGPEIDAEYAANHLDPEDILPRTLRQRLLEDGANFSWLKHPDAQFESRRAVRERLNQMALSWDDAVEGLRPQADILAAALAGAQEPTGGTSMLKQSWTNAALFAPSKSVLRVASQLSLLEDALYDM